MQKLIFLHQRSTPRNQMFNLWNASKSYAHYHTLNNSSRTITTQHPRGRENKKKVESVAIKTNTTLTRVPYLERHVINILFLFDEQKSKIKLPEDEEEEANGGEANGGEAKENNDKSGTIKDKYGALLKKNNGAPLDVFVSRYFRKFDNVGSRNSWIITQDVFDIVRWMTFLNCLCTFDRNSMEFKKSLEMYSPSWMKFENYTLDEEDSQNEMFLTQKLNDRRFSLEERKNAKEELRTINKRKLIMHDIMAYIWKKDNFEALLKWRQKYYTFHIYVPKLIKALSTPGFPNNEIMPQNFKTLMPNVLVSCPLELFDMLVTDYGLKKANEICAVNNTRAPFYCRLTFPFLKQKADLSVFLERLNEELGFSCKRDTEGGTTLCIKFEQRTNIMKFDSKITTYLDVQDKGSQMIANLIEPKPGDLVLDYCGGSGGKTLAIAHKMYNTKTEKLEGTIFLSDVRESALREARERLKRAEITHVQPIHQSHPQMPKLINKIDWVILDVPCSGTGTIRRNPDLKYKINAKWVSELVELQRKIFDEGIQYLRKKGNKPSYLVYSTCSVLSVENEKQTQHFLSKYGDVIEFVREHKNLPQFDGMDGFYGVVFRAKTKSKP